MMSSPSPEIYLRSTSSVSLHDRFTNMLKNKESELTNLQQLKASLKNQRLAQQMANWPSVLAALHTIPSLKQRMGRRNIKGRLNRPMMGRGLRGMTRHWSRPRGRGSFLRGTLSVRCSRGLQGEVSGVVKQGLMNQHNGAHISRPGVMQHSGIRRPMRGQGGRGVSVGGGWDVRRHWAGSRPVPTQEELDEQLDDYMSMTKSHLDAQLDEYMAEVDSENVI